MTSKIPCFIMATHFTMVLKNMLNAEWCKIFFQAPVWARGVKGAVRQRDDDGDPGEGDGGDHHQHPLLLRHQPEGPRHATGAVTTLAVKFTQK